MTEYKGVASGILDGVELEVRCFPDPVLKKPAEPVEEFDEELADFVARMHVALLKMRTYTNKRCEKGRALRYEVCGKILFLRT